MSYKVTKLNTKLFVEQTWELKKYALIYIDIYNFFYYNNNIKKNTTCWLVRGNKANWYTPVLFILTNLH